MKATTAAQKKRTLVVLGACVIVALLAAGLLARAFDLKELLVRTLAVITSAGPWTFFIAMAVLPAFGCPMLTFALPAGPAFTPLLGRAGTIAAYSGAVAVDLALAYWISRYALRPLVAWLVGRLGYTVPRFAKDEQIEVAVLVRVTPGTPFFLQSYLLGLGEMPFVPYMLVSWPIATAYGVGFVLAGDAIVHGQGGMAVFGVGVLLVAVIGVHLLRKHYGRRNRQPVR